MSTPLPVIALVSRIVTKSVDRVTGDRSDYPLLVSLATQYALSNLGIQAQVFYGPAAWVEVLEDHRVVWAGCWGEHFHFWTATQFGEVVDLNTSVAFRKRSHAQPDLKAKYSPPMLWSAEVPRFYRYQPIGIAEVSPTEERDQRWQRLIFEDLDAHCRPDFLPKEDSLAFPPEAILCPQRRVLDDSAQTFRHFERVLATQGIPESPI